MDPISFFTVDANLHKELSKTFAISLSSQNVSNTDWQFTRINRQLTLQGVLDHQGFSLSFQLESPQMAYRLVHGGGRKEPLLKALGLKPNETATVVDATAGMGRESVLISHFGYRVIAIERQPIIHALLADALRRFDQTTDSAGKIELIYGDSIDVIEELKDTADVVYMDPMFPERDKSAAVKKEMRIFKKLAGADLDDAELLNIALAKSQKRVVVKRPIKADFIGNISPSHQITSKKHRFDVYMV
ncbi:MAG: class I SAM-dependent methyltransferase [Kangiellaceae bacterium]|jgi:16S rRNA (guanine1516-N2)-methyltransferase|nr:class I SAM-dependent methyltransferase [Kangiellaceae bacterium]